MSKRALEETIFKWLHKYDFLKKLDINIQISGFAKHYERFTKRKKYLNWKFLFSFPVNVCLLFWNLKKLLFIISSLLKLKYQNYKLFRIHIFYYSIIYEIPQHLPVQDIANIFEITSSFVVYKSKLLIKK